MQLLGKSEFGSSYFDTNKLLENSSHHISLKQFHRNWDPEDFAWGLHMISLSIQNIVVALKILNGISAEKVKFIWPSDLAVLSEPWKRIYQIGVTSLGGFDHEIPSELVKPFSKEFILSEYSKGKDAGIRRFKFSENDKS